MPNLRAVLEIANSSEELKKVVLPFVQQERHQVLWQAIDEVIKAREPSRGTKVALAWAKALYGASVENQQALFGDFEQLEKPVQEAIMRAIAIRYEVKR